MYRTGSRRQSTAVHFYQNRLLELYASKEPTPLTLRQLQFYGKSITESRLIKSANYVRTELAVRIAHRLRDMQALPYIVVTEESVAKVYELYWLAFEKFRQFPPINSLQDNIQFCRFTRQLLDEHATVIPSLSLGLSLASPRLSPDQLDSFMRRMLTSRISRRVLAEHHIALSEDFYNKPDRTQNEGQPHVGIIFTGLNVRDTVQKCAELLQQRPPPCEHGTIYQKGIVHQDRYPDVVIDGFPSTQFSYIREHLEYIIFEILKNSIHATQLQYSNSTTLPPIRVTVVASDDDVTMRISDQGGGLLTASNPILTPLDLFSFSHIRNAKRLEGSRLGALRSRSVTGMKGTVEEQVNMWNETTELDKQSEAQEVDESARIHPHIGIGLPMSNIYAAYFGGSLDLVSVDGWGTDVYLRLPKLGTNLEGITL